MFKSFSIRLIGNCTSAFRKTGTTCLLRCLSSQCINSRLIRMSDSVRLVPRSGTGIHSFLVQNCGKRNYGEDTAADTSVSDACCISKDTMEEHIEYSQFSSLAEDASTEKRIKLVLMEYEISKQSGGRVPSIITVDDMKELLQIASPASRTRYFNYLFKTEKNILKDKRRKEKRRIAYEERLANISGPKNTFFVHIRNPAMLKFYNSRQAHSILFGSTIVFDMGYEEFMSKRDSINCAQQISMAYGMNKVHQDPFNIYLCNAKSDYKTLDFIAQSIPHLYAANCLINVTEQSYLDVFSKNQIVYLTPNAHETLDKFDHDTVYVVGAFVDKSQPKPVSLAKAKRENLRMAKLPLDYYLPWGAGTKSLTINQMMEIMLELKNSNNWKEALKFVPSRKLHKINLEDEKARFNKKKNDLARKLNIASLFQKE